MENTRGASLSGPVRGALIVLEGLDRSGKTTQVKLLEERLTKEGRQVQALRFPDRTTPIGQMIDSYLKSQVDMDDNVIHLLFSANRWEAARSITALLVRGVTVLVDRYYYSGMVYSAAKENPLLSLAWARAPEVGLPRPDLVVFLDLEEAQAKARGGWGTEIYEKVEMQRRVRKLFWGLSFGRVELGSSEASTSHTETGTQDVHSSTTATRELIFRQEEEDLYVIDASPRIEAVADSIWKVVHARVDAVARGEVGRTVRRVT